MPATYFTLSSPNQIPKFEIGDADAELGKVCFSAMISFKREEEYVRGHQMEVGVRERYKSVIGERRPDSWELVPRVDSSW